MTIYFLPSPYPHSRGLIEIFWPRYCNDPDRLKGMMEYQDFAKQLQLIGKDPSKLIFEDDLTGIFNRR